MPIMINEQRMVDANTFLYEERIKSPAKRFIDTTPVYVTYYNINNVQSTTDEGFLDVEAYTGAKSPLRFSKIENFPVYGIDNIVLQINDTEVGLDSTYEGDGIILPGTIKPLVNDYFIIPTLKDDYVFRITNIGYDNLMPDNYYKFEFKLEYIDREEMLNLENQTTEEFICDLPKIGTNDACIIRKSYFVTLEKIMEMYHNIVEFYTSMFYDTRHNVFLCQLDMVRKLYDPLQIEFVNKHNLLKEKNAIVSTILTDEFTDPKRAYKYNRSIYKYVELRDHKLLSIFPYVLRPGITIRESSFWRWHDKTVECMELPLPGQIPAGQMLSDEFVETIKTNGETDNEFSELIKRYVNGEELHLSDIPLSLADELIYLNNDIEVFFFTPIIMYIIKDIAREDIKSNTKPPVLPNTNM